MHPEESRDYIDDWKEQYAELREEFYAGLEERSALAVSYCAELRSFRRGCMALRSREDNV